MAKPIINQLIDKLESSVSDFDTAIPGIQKDIADEVEKLIHGLDTKGNAITSSVSNLRKIGAFKSKIITIIKDSGYDSLVDKFAGDFTDVESLLSDYFSEIAATTFKTSPALKVIRLQTLTNTIDQLTENGLYANFINPITEMLTKNVTSGMSWQEMNKQLRDFIVTNKNKVGGLQRWTKQITNGSINNYAGQYIQIASKDLKLDWYIYQGPIMDTSRPWCEACHKRKYLHRSEFPMLIAGDFPEFDEFEGKIYEKTGLPSGMDAGTTVLNLQVNCGGHVNNCQHQMYPIAEIGVPVSRRIETYTEQGIEFDEKTGRAV